MSTYSVGQMNQLGDALEAAGYSLEDVTKLRSSIPLLEQLKGVLGGTAQIVVVRDLIDLEVDPFVPDGWAIEKHIRGGEFEWDLAKVALYLSLQQQNGKVIQGFQFREELKGKPVYNANLLDYLLAHPELIPKGWKGKFVFFWGTIYRDPGGGVSVRYLCWHGDRWDWHFRWLGGDFLGHDPAAVAST